MPLEALILRVVLTIVPEVIDRVRRGDTDAAVLAHAKRLGIDTAFEEARRERERRH